MKNNVPTLQFFGFAFTSLGGTLLHFLYDWTNESIIIAPFSGVNESTWEHMKLIFFPMFLFAAVESRFVGKGLDSFWCVKLKGTVLALVLIPVIFYTYNGVIGQSPDWINIAIFFISAAVAYIYETRQFNNGTMTCKSSKIVLAVLFVIALLFVIFTFATPEISIFKDPLSGAYGI